MFIDVTAAQDDDYLMIQAGVLSDLHVYGFTWLWKESNYDPQLKATTRWTICLSDGRRIDYDGVFKCSGLVFTDRQKLYAWLKGE